MNSSNEQVTAINDLRSQIQMNSFGLPTGFYRVDMLPFDDYEPGPILAPAPPIPKALKDAPPLVTTIGLEQLEEAIEAAETLNAALEHVDEDEDDDALFDPVTFEPLTVIDRTPRLREHPLITSRVRPTPTPALEGGEEDGVVGELIDHSVLHRTAGFITADIEGAFVALDYSEGFPTFENGDPFWTCLKYEDPEAYRAFVQYLEMSAGGKMGLDMVDGDLVDPKDDDNTRAASGFRSISHLADVLERDNVLVLAKQEQLKEWYQLYYWEWRAKAYDMFRVVQFRSSQEIRAMETQDQHYIVGRKLMLRAAEFMESTDFTDLLTPKIALDMMRLATQLERTSVGLSVTGGGAGNGVEEPRVTSMQVSLKRIANNSREEDEIDIGGSSTEALDQALMDPEKTELMQELILEMQLTEPGR